MLNLSHTCGISLCNLLQLGIQFISLVFLHRKFCTIQQTEVFMSDYIVNKSQNDIYSTDEITQTRLYPFKVPKTYNTTVSTWLSYLYDLFSSKVSVNKGIIFLHNGYVKSLFDNVSTANEFDIKQHHVFVNSSLTRMVETKYDLTVTVRNWDIIGNIGSALLPYLCKGRLGKGKYRCF